jgi:hypothetical protein
VAGVGRTYRIVAPLTFVSLSLSLAAREYGCAGMCVDPQRSLTPVRRKKKGGKRGAKAAKSAAGKSPSQVRWLSTCALCAYMHVCLSVCVHTRVNWREGV